MDSAMQMDPRARVGPFLSHLQSQVKSLLEHGAWEAHVLTS